MELSDKIMSLRKAKGWSQEELAKQHNIQMPMDQLLVKAEAFAIRAGGRSPRVAKQFIEQCEAGVQK